MFFLGNKQASLVQNPTSTKKVKSTSKLAEKNLRKRSLNSTSNVTNMQRVNLKRRQASFQLSHRSDSFKNDNKQSVKRRKQYFPRCTSKTLSKLHKLRRCCFVSLLKLSTIIKKSHLFVCCSRYTLTHRRELFCSCWVSNASFCSQLLYIIMISDWLDAFIDLFWKHTPC
jgi:hypothetical protein